MSKIQATVVADSINEWNDRLTSIQVTLPRIILAELGTHRMFSRNTASSRAIPFTRMLKSVLRDPFVPLAWQKDHPGMQGTEYFASDQLFDVEEVRELLFDKIKQAYLQDGEEAGIDVGMAYSNILSTFQGKRTLREFWLLIRDRVVECAILLHSLGVSKQLCNRLLEPFAWVTVLISATEWDNFFTLRCPQYNQQVYKNDPSFRSWKDFVRCYESETFKVSKATPLDRLKVNKGQAEIHMMALAEAIWDARNASTPKLLKAGEWHIPYESQLIDREREDEFLSLQNIDQVEAMKFYQMCKVKLATVMAARTSYTVVGEDLKPMSYEKMLELDAKLVHADPLHASPLEHCARTMNISEYESHVSGRAFRTPVENMELMVTTSQAEGWCRNFRGFIQRRVLVENG